MGWWMPLLSAEFSSFAGRTYDLVLADPPWPYEGSKTKDQACGKHYESMSLYDLGAMPVRPLLAKRAWVFLWVTSPKMHLGVALLSLWGLHFRGVPYVWCKATQAGKIIGGQGARPSHVKPTTEFVICGGTHKTGRLLPILDEGQHQVVVAPRPGNVHSAKPPEVRARIEALFGPIRRLEMFARESAPGWDSFGNQLPGMPGRR